MDLFIGLIFLNKDLASYQGNVGAILGNFVLAYVVAPLPALDYVLLHSSEYSHAIPHTFEFLSKILAWAGFQTRVPNGLDSYVFVPLPTNVYTVYKFFFTDFGFFSMFAAIAIIGFSQTLVYRRAAAGGRVSLVLCALLVYPAILSIFDDAYSGAGLFFMLKATFLAAVYFGVLSRLSLGFAMPRFKLGIWPAHGGRYDRGPCGFVLPRSARYGTSLIQASQVKWIPCSRLTTLPAQLRTIHPILEGFGKPVSYVPLGKNRGIAEAQNIGIDLSIKGEYSHVLLLDQDSALLPAW